MDNDTFDRLPGDKKLQCLLGYASMMFGQDTVRTLHDRLAPLVHDCVGHGQECADPRDNAWGGVWQIYRAE
jgi:hypothetical protein